MRVLQSGDCTTIFNLYNSNAFFGEMIDRVDYNSVGEAIINTGMFFRQEFDGTFSGGGEEYTQIGAIIGVSGNLGDANVSDKFGIKVSAIGTADVSYAGWFSASGATENWGIFNAAGNVFLGDFGEFTYWGDTAIGIYSQADTFLDLFADGGVRIGDSSAGAPTTYMNISPGGDTHWVGAGSGLFYGNMDQSAGAFNVTLTTINVWVELDAATTNIVAGPLNNMTFDGDHFLKANTTGAYTVVYSLIPAIDSVAGGDQHIEFQVFKNGAVTGKGETHVTFKNILRELPVASDTLLSLTAGDEISVGARNTSSSGKVISVDHLEMTMVMVGG